MREREQGEDYKEKSAGKRKEGRKTGEHEVTECMKERKRKTREMKQRNGEQANERTPSR